MFSGGLDSTAMLVKLLAESDDELRVHHIHMANQEGRDERGAARGRRDPRLLPPRTTGRSATPNPASISARSRRFRSTTFRSRSSPARWRSIRRAARASRSARSPPTPTSRTAARASAACSTRCTTCYRARKLGEPRVEWIYPVYDQPKSALVAALPGELLEPDVVLSAAPGRRTCLRRLQGLPRAGKSLRRGLARPCRGRPKSSFLRGRAP